jgi:hypothetical protein
MVVLLDPPYREYEVRWKKLNQLLRQLLEKLPAGSVIAVESGRVLTGRVLPGFDDWDVRRYGGTQVAFREVGPRGATVDQDNDEVGATDDDADA